MANSNLRQAKSAKNDEFYTQWADIEREVRAYLDCDPAVFRGKTILCPCDDPEWSNFTKFFALHFHELGLRKLISTSFAVESKNYQDWYQPSLFEQESEKFDKKKTRSRGKIFILDGADLNNDGEVNIHDLKWDYLQGDGDFQSPEVQALLAEADMIITNPPFSLFRDFLSWIVTAKQPNSQTADFSHKEHKEAQGEQPFDRTNRICKTVATALCRRAETAERRHSGVATETAETAPHELSHKKFLIIGNMNAITYKEVFPLIMKNQLWLGATGFNAGMYFYVPENFVYADTYKFERERDGEKVNRVPGVCWFTNIDHGRRHEPLALMTLEHNLKFSRHKEIKGKVAYDTYDNYRAIEVPFTDSIPSDYPGVMGVPISFLDKYCPEQFEILGMCENIDLYGLKSKVYSTKECQQAYFDKFQKKGTYDLNASGVIRKDGLLEKVYQRILIKHRHLAK